MKKQLFTLVMMLALVIVGGSAMAQTNVTPYPGGTYSYSLSGIKVNTAGTATIVCGSTGGNVQTVNLGATSPYAVLTTTNTLTFDVKYPTNATAGKIVVTITDGVGGCSNFIELAITPAALPVFALTIAASADQYCQNSNSAPANNKDASIGAAANSFTFTVSPTVTNATTAYTYGYSIALNNVPGLTGYNIAYTGPGIYAAGAVTGANANTDGVFTVTFTTTTGLAPQIITGTLSAASLTVTSGSGVYGGTIGTAAKAVTVKTMPSIGAFTIQ